MALERGARGEALHAVAEVGVPFRRIAEAVGRQVGVPTVSLTPEQAEQHFGALAMWVTGNGPALSKATHASLGWIPRQLDLTSDIEHPEYGDPAGLRDVS